MVARWKHLGSKLLPPKAGLLLEGSGGKQRRSSSRQEAAYKYSNITSYLQDWSGTDWSNQQQPNGEVASWSGQASVEQPEPPVDPAAPTTAPVIDPNADIWKAVVLFTFQANNEDEINITENEQVDIMVKECDEEGWVMVRNSSGQKGYAPTNYLEVFASETLGNQQGVSGLSQPMQTIPENAEPPPVRGGWGGEGGWAGQDWGGGNQQQDTGGRRG